MPTIITANIHTTTPNFAVFHPLTASVSVSGWSTPYLALNYRIECQIHNNSGTEYATFFERTNDDGTIDDFRIDRFLTSQFNLLDLPDLTTTTAVLYPGYHFKFYMKYRELYTGTTGSWVDDANTYNAFASAQARGNTNGAEIVDYAASAVASQKSFMTFFEIPRQTQGKTFGLSIIWRDNDDTACTLRQSYDDPALGSPTTNDTAITLRNGLNYVNIPDYGLTESTYYCWIETEVDAVQEPITEYKQIKFVLECSSQESTQIAWINRLGALEFWTFCCKRFEEAVPGSGQVFQGDFDAFGAGAYSDELLLEKAERKYITVGEKITNADHAQAISQMLTSALVGEVNSAEAFLPRLVKEDSWTYRNGVEVGNNFEVTLIEPEQYKPHN